MLDKLFLMLELFHNYYFPNNDIVLEHFLLLIDEKNPWKVISLKESFLFKYCFLLTLQASHVTAPKWIPDADAPQTRHGNFLYKSSVFGPTDSRISQMNKERKNEWMKKIYHEVSFQLKYIFEIDNIDIEFENVLLLNKRNLFDIYIFYFHHLLQLNEEKISKQTNSFVRSKN